MNLSPVFRQRFFDSNGLPLAGGKLYSYAAGTTAPQATYSNATGTANTNPVILDSSGYADVWLDPTLAYKFILKTSADAQIWSVDNVTGSTAGISTWSTNAVYNQGQLVTDSSGQGLIYVSLSNNNQNNALTNVSAWRVFAGNVRTLSASSPLLVTDDLIRSDSSTGNMVQTLPACATTPVGKEITVKDVGTSGNHTTVKGAGSDLIDGFNTYGTVLVQYGQVTVKNNGTSWDVTNASSSLFTGLTTSNLSTTAGIVGTQLANATVTATQIASATITGTQVASSINLPGNAVKENGQNVVVANTNLSSSLSIIRGWFIGATATLRYGEGCTMTRSGTGQYTVTFTTPFSASPICTVSAVTSGGLGAAATIVSPFGSTSSLNLWMFRPATASEMNGGSDSMIAYDTDFTFIAIGPR